MEGGSSRRGREHSACEQSHVHPWAWEGHSLGWGSTSRGAGIQGGGAVLPEGQATPALCLLPLQVEGHPEGYS